jgi:hypothetical protein
MGADADAEASACVGADAGAGLGSSGDTSSIGTNRAEEVSLLRELDLRGGIMNGDGRYIVVVV